MDDYRRKKLPQNRNLIDSFQDEFYKKYQEKLSGGILVYRKKVSWSQTCMSRFCASAVARLLTCNTIFQRLKGEKNSLHDLLHQESVNRGYFQKKNEIMLRDLKMYA